MKDREKKKENNNLQLIVLLLVALIIFAAYWYGYRYFVEKSEILTAENEDYQAKISDLRAKISRRAEYEQRTVANYESVSDILALYGPGNTEEKSLMLIVDIEKLIDISISVVTFAQDYQIFSYTGLPNMMGLPILGLQTSLSITYKTTYNGLKEFVDYINKYPERMNVRALSSSYDAETGNLTGNAVINLYSVLSFDSPYIPPDIYGVLLGTYNIFGTSELWRREFE